MTETINGKNKAKLITLDQNVFVKLIFISLFLNYLVKNVQDLLHCPFEFSSTLEQSEEVILPSLSLLFTQVYELVKASQLSGDVVICSLQSAILTSPS